MRAILLVLATLLTGCGHPQVDARRTFNEGVSALSSGDADAATEKLLSARDSAGTDDALRLRAAYDLGLAWVAKAEKAEGPDDKLSDLRQSAAWFRDAVRLDPKDDDARANLEIVLHRATAVADQMNQDQNRLEGRLKAVIEDARALRDGVRQLLGQLDAGGAQTDPQAFQDSFDKLATQDRALSAQVGTVLDLAGDELDGLGQKADDDLSDKEKARQYQLNALETWVNSARTSLTSGRADLRDLDARGAHTQATRSLAELKRAAEQLSDPIQVLQAVTRDEATLRQKTAVLMQAGALSVNDATADDNQPVPALPSWFSADSLDEEQGTIADRAGEIAARLDAASQAEAPEDEKQQRLLALATEAAPFVHTGVEHMAQARQALVSGSVGQAILPETQALSSLSEALERFSDLRTLVDLAWTTQDQITTLMDPSQGDASLSAADRMQAVAEGVSRNRSRLERLKPLIADDRAKAQAAADKAQADSDDSDDDNDDGGGDTGQAQ
ncbi:MAG: hypothetical protein GXP62_00100, partial [Oligoflexia bacterium]|nr:hypothetical protein [Oligoflexia bacterium]